MPIAAIDFNLISPHLVHTLHAHVTIEGSKGIVHVHLHVLANRPYDIIAMRKWNEWSQSCYSSILLGTEAMSETKCLENIHMYYKTK